MNNQDFADLIARTLEHGVQVVELADALSVSLPTITRWTFNQNLPGQARRLMVRNFIFVRWGIR